MIAIRYIDDTGIDSGVKVENGNIILVPIKSKDEIRILMNPLYKVFTK